MRNKASRNIISDAKSSAGKLPGSMPSKAMLVLLASAISAPSTAQDPGSRSDGDWSSYNRTLAGDRFSPLSEINGGNVGRLARQCEYPLPKPTSFQTGPLAIDGVLYFTSPDASFAIDASTCEERWRVSHPAPTGEGVVSANRGFAYLDGRLFRGTLDGHVLALSPEDGRTLWDARIPDAGPGVTIPMAPIAADGKVFVGNAGGDRAGITGHAYHNLRAMRTPDGYAASRRFDEWLRETMTEVAPAEREARLLRWTEAPAARAVHPHEDHLLPLMVAVGAAGDAPASVSYHQEDFSGGLAVSSFRLGAPPGEAA